MNYYIPRFYWRNIHNDVELDGFRGYTFGVQCGRYVIHIELIRDAE